MSISANVVDGVLQQTNTSATSISESTKSSPNSLGKEDFLQLLVAQMQYQDPLEPTSNTEYVSQFATFSELEQMQNVSQSSDMNRASNLVGQTVIMKVTSTSTGETSYVQGKVDYVMYENSKAFLSINDSLYSIDDLDTVIDPKYLEAHDAAQEVAKALKDLPALKTITDEKDPKVLDMLAKYDALSEYSLSFLQQSVKENVEAYRNKLQELKNKKSESGEEVKAAETT